MAAKEQRERRFEVAKRMEKINKDAKGRALTADEQKSWDDSEREWEELGRDITVREQSQWAGERRVPLAA